MFGNRRKPPTLAENLRSLAEESASLVFVYDTKNPTLPQEDPRLVAHNVFGLNIKSPEP